MADGWRGGVSLSATLARSDLGAGVGGHGDGGPRQGLSGAPYMSQQFAAA